jgi:hypothetical protein
MAEKTNGLAERVARLKAQLLDDVKEILAEEAGGNEDAFVGWLPGDNYPERPLTLIDAL